MHSFVQLNFNMARAARPVEGCGVWWHCWEGLMLCHISRMFATNVPCDSVRISSF